MDHYRAQRGRPINHEDNEQIPVDEQEATAGSQGAAFTAGDILLIRFGWVTHVDRSGAGYHGRCCGPEHSEATAAWLWDHQFSLVAADNIALEACDHSSLPAVVAEANGTLPFPPIPGCCTASPIPLLAMYIGELWDLNPQCRSARTCLGFPQHLMELRTRQLVSLVLRTRELGEPGARRFPRQAHG